MQMMVTKCIEGTSFLVLQKYVYSALKSSIFGMQEGFNHFGNALPTQFRNTLIYQERILVSVLFRMNLGCNNLEICKTANI